MRFTILWKNLCNIYLVIYLVWPHQDQSFLDPVWPWGLAELVHEEAYPCLLDSFWFVLETIDTSTVNVSLVQFVPSINNLLWEEVFPNVQITAMFNNFPWMASSPLLTVNCEDGKLQKSHSSSWTPPTDQLESFFPPTILFQELSADHHIPEILSRVTFLWTSVELFPVVVCPFCSV